MPCSTSFPGREKALGTKLCLALAPFDDTKWKIEDNTQCLSLALLLWLFRYFVHVSVLHGQPEFVTKELLNKIGHVT